MELIQGKMPSNGGLSHQEEYLSKKEEHRLLGRGPLIIFIICCLLYIIFQVFYDKETSFNVTQDIGIISGENINTGQIISTSTKTEYEKFLDFSKSAKKLDLISGPIISHFNPSDPAGNDVQVKYIYSTYGRKISPLEITEGGYLYVRATVNQDQLGPKDSIYLYFKDNGGHLLKSKSLIPVPNQPYTELLYNLSGVDFAKIPSAGYDDRKNMGDTPKNLQTLLSTNNNIFFFGFVSTNRNGRLEEVKIVYK